MRFSLRVALAAATAATLILTGCVTVSLPATATEGDAPKTGTVTASAAPTSNVIVSLTSSAPADATVPATVTLLAGQS